MYAAVEPFAYSLLSGSENRLFLLYLNDAEAFSQRYADKLLYMEKDVPRTVRTTGDVSDADSLPPSEEPSVPDAEAFTRWELAELGVYDALSVTDGSGVTVAVLDSGIDRAHSAFADADIAAGYDAVAHRPGVDGDASGHGTKVAGILAARFSGAEETLGAAPGVTLYPIKVSEDGQTLYTSSLIYALHLAADAGVDVINMSLGGYSRSEAEADAVEYAHRRGCILVAAAGNEGGDETYAGRYSYPASYDHVISVGAYRAGRADLRLFAAQRRAGRRRARRSAHARRRRFGRLCDRRGDKLRLRLCLGRRRPLPRRAARRAVPGRRRAGQAARIRARQRARR